MQYVDEYTYLALRAARGEFTALACICATPNASQLLTELVSIMANSPDEDIEIAIDLARLLPFRSLHTQSEQ